MNFVEQFLSDSQECFNWLLRIGRTFISRTYGTLNSTPSLTNVIFIVALLPVVLGFAVEIIFSFILSFRMKRPVIFNPLRISSYKLNNSFIHRGNLVFSKKYLKHNLSHLRYFSFFKPETSNLVSSTDFRERNKLFNYRSNEIRPFYSRFRKIISIYPSGFSTSRYRLSGRFVTVNSRFKLHYGNNSKK